MVSATSLTPLQALLATRSGATSGCTGKNAVQLVIIYSVCSQQGAFLKVVETDWHGKGARVVVVQHGIHSGWAAVVIQLVV